MNGQNFFENKKDFISLFMKNVQFVESYDDIEYNPDEEAPKIIASGRGIIADKIIDKAKENDVPVYQDSKLANTLSKLEIGDMIPPELYGVVAEILVFVDECDRIRGKVKH